MKAYPYPVATFNSFVDARKLKERLHRAGIPALIHNEAKVERYWFLSKPLAAVHVEVPQPYYLESRRLIDQWDDAEGIMNNAVRCPHCHSSRIEFPQLTRKFVMPVLIGHILSLFGVMHREFYCQDCHYTWPAKPHPEAPSRPMWPLSSKPWRSKKA